jgi:septal ring factor EnvC (AmiA/AmiB activator)
MQNKMEGQSSRIEQAWDRFSELEDEKVSKGKTKEHLVKQLKTCEKKTHDLTDSIKRPNLIIMGIEEREEVQVKLMCKTFNKIITEPAPRWRLEGGSRKRASYTEILELCRRHTLQAKPPRRGKTLTPPQLQPVQRISTSR